ncbi:MAG: hypothetical protein K1V81_04270 [Paramuribaculum sp.]|jgi:hypothetical protein
MNKKGEVGYDAMRRMTGSVGLRPSVGEMVLGKGKDGGDADPPRKSLLPGNPPPMK